MKKSLSLFLRGIPIGISLTLPGVSGGTMALVLGIYDRLILAIKKVNLFFLLPVSLGGALGLWLGAGFITFFLDNFPDATMAFLLGLVIFSIKVTLKEVHRWNYKGILAMAVGLAIALILWNLSKDDVVAGTVSNIQLFVAGFVSSVAMILPGISGATLLIMFGLYGGVLEAVQSFNVLILVIYGGGAVVGLFSFSWILSYLLTNYRNITMITLSGLILGSARAVIPESFGVMEFCAFTMGAGLILILSNERFKKLVRNLLTE